MKTQIVLLTMIIGILASGAAWAATQSGDGNPQRTRFERVDADGNGRIDRQEFGAAREARFARMDADGNGAITLAELEDAARRDHAARRFERMDADADGQVTRQEFAALGDRMFEHLDENADGYLSMGELERRRHRGATTGAPAN
ncbi:MAG: EF-hand domain-containing protein [Rhodospirillales bacterium]|nr:MAG: EF-hand domain-containing protein [Rhodospirillales bacterium]